MPKSRLHFWLPKLEKNVARDKQVLSDLEEHVWKALIIWECELKDKEAVRDRVERFLEDA